MTDTKTPTSIRPTALGEKTIFATLIALCLLAVGLCLSLFLGAWPETVAAERIKFLGWGLILSLGGIVVLIIAFASPYIGTVKATGMGASLEIDGPAQNADGAQ